MCGSHHILLKLNKKIKKLDVDSKDKVVGLISAGWYECLVHGEKLKKRFDE